MYSPDFFFGLVPPGWVSDRAREPFWYGLNLLPLVAFNTVTIEQVFDKSHDTLLFGGTAYLTLTTEASIVCPLSGVWSRCLARMKNPAGNRIYSEVFTNSGSQTVRDTGFVPAENLFSCWQQPAARPVYWPIPIAVPRGGSLQIDIQSLSPGTQNVRLGLWAVTLYESEDEIAA